MTNILSLLRPARPAAALAAAVLSALLAGGCGESTTTPPPPPLTSELMGVSGRAVTWTTNLPTRGAVRYGFVAGRQDHLAYPAVAGGGDKSYGTTHVVPLLGVPPQGATVYVRRADRAQDGRFFVADEETLVLDPFPATGPLLTFTTLDVQFGDAHVLRLPTEGRVVVIDAGSPYESLNEETAPRHVMRWLDDRAIDRLDVAIGTHVHADHIGGFVEADGDGAAGLFDRFVIGAYLDVPAVTETRTLYSRLQVMLAERGIPRLVIASGMTSDSDPAELAWDNLVDVVVLNAGAQPAWDGGDENNDSVVLKVSYGEVDLITGGDCLVAGEERILSLYGGELAGVEYFKSSHHGRDNANSAPYLLAIAPRVAVIPVAFAAYYEGADQGAQDTAQTLERLGALGADVFRFDAADPLGHVQDDRTFWHTNFVTDGISYEIRIEPSIWGI